MVKNRQKTPIFPAAIHGENGHFPLVGAFFENDPKMVKNDDFSGFFTKSDKKHSIQFPKNRLHLWQRG